MSSPASRIVIIGAGIGGLTLALLPRRRRIIAEILEQAPELREVGAAVALAANGTRVLQYLDLGDGLARASSEFTEIIHRDGRDGSRIAAHVMGRQYREAFGDPIADGSVINWCCSATPRTGCSRTMGRERARRSRTAPCWRPSWTARATSAVLHLPDGPAAQVRGAYLASLPERLAWIHGYDILAQSPGKSSPRRRRGREGDDERPVPRRRSA